LWERPEILSSGFICNSGLADHPESSMQYIWFSSMYLCKPALMKNNGLQQADENQQLPDRLPDFLHPFHGHNGPIESIDSLLGNGHSEMSAMPRRRMLEIVVYSSPADGKCQAKGGSA